MQTINNWWMVVLQRGKISNIHKDIYLSEEKNWNTNPLKYHKHHLYMEYKKVCVGEPKGILMFWKYFFADFLKCSIFKN